MLPKLAAPRRPRQWYSRPPGDHCGNRSWNRQCQATSGSCQSRSSLAVHRLLFISPVLHHRALGNCAVMAGQAHHDATDVAVSLGGRTTKPLGATKRTCRCSRVSIGKIAEVDGLAIRADPYPARTGRWRRCRDQPWCRVRLAARSAVAAVRSVAASATAAVVVMGAQDVNGGRDAAGCAGRILVAPAVTCARATLTNNAMGQSD